MTKEDNKLQLNIIGRAEFVDIPLIGANKVPAKVDTGADSSSIWVSQAYLDDSGKLSVVFFGPGSDHYTGKVVNFENSQYSRIRIANSFDHKELRYKIKLPVKIKSKLIRATFTLSNRDSKVYPILIGRKMLAGKFLVDVQGGSPLLKQEHHKRVGLRVSTKNNQRGNL